MCVGLPQNFAQISLKLTLICLRIFKFHKFWFQILGVQILPVIVVKICVDSDYLSTFRELCGFPQTPHYFKIWFTFGLSFFCVSNFVNFRLTAQLVNLKSQTLKSRFQKFRDLWWILESFSMSRLFKFLKCHTLWILNSLLQISVLNHGSQDFLTCSKLQNIIFLCPQNFLDFHHFKVCKFSESIF